MFAIETPDGNWVGENEAGKRVTFSPEHPNAWLFNTYEEAVQHAHDFERVIEVDI